MPPPLTSLLLGFERYTVRQTEVRGSLDNVLTFHVMKCTTDGAMVLAIMTTNLMSTLRMTLMIRVCLLLVIRRGLVLCPVILTTGMLMKWTTPCIHDDNAFDSSDDASYSSSSPGSSNFSALDGCVASPQEKVHLLGGMQSNKKTQQSNMQRDK